jgi:hypothetical protein
MCSISWLVGSSICVKVCPATEVARQQSLLSAVLTSVREVAGATDGGVCWGI